MIELIGNPGDTTCRIRFSPRTGFKTKVPVIDRDLVYGHYCPQCANVVQALFLTDEPVDLWPYEQTHVMSMGKSDAKAGTILKIVPNVESKPGYTNYTSTRLRNGSTPGQHIVLKNHVLRYHGLERDKYTTDQFFEPGERTCEYTGIFSIRADMLVRDVCMFMRMNPSDLMKYNLPPVDEFLKAAVTYEFRSLPAYGAAPPVVLLPRERMTYSYGYEWQMRNILAAFEKSKQQQAAETAATKDE